MISDTWSIGSWRRRDVGALFLLLLFLSRETELHFFKVDGMFFLRIVEHVFLYLFLVCQSLRELQMKNYLEKRFHLQYSDHICRCFRAFYVFLVFFFSSPSARFQRTFCCCCLQGYQQKKRQQFLVVSVRKVIEIHLITLVFHAVKHHWSHISISIHLSIVFCNCKVTVESPSVIFLWNIVNMHLFIIIFFVCNSSFPHILF